MTAVFTIQITLAILGIALTIASIESLYARNIYRPANWLSWDRIKYNRPFFRHPKAGPVFDFLFQYPHVTAILTIRLLLSAALPVIIYMKMDFTLALYLLTAINLLFSLRNAFANNGADQLSNIVLMAACISTIDPGNESIRIMSLIFIAVQVSLAYFISGFHKINPGWLSGVYLKGVLSTEIFGNRFILRTFSRTKHSFWFFSIVMIVTELLLAFSMFFNPSFVIWLLLVGCIFHLAVAFIMGFNTFLFTFLSTYPAIYFVSHHGIKNLINQLAYIVIV